MNYPKVKLPKQGLAENTYTCDGSKWASANLVQYCKEKHYPIFDLPLAGIDLGLLPWSDLGSVKNIAKHVKRILHTDLKHPVILDDNGYIADGWHRIVKALVLGETSVKAIRIQEMPNPDGDDRKD